MTRSSKRRWWLFATVLLASLLVMGAFLAGDVAWERFTWPVIAIPVAIGAAMAVVIVWITRNASR